MQTTNYPFPTINRSILVAFTNAPWVDVGEWQSQDISGRDDMITKELRHVNYGLQVPQTWQRLAEIIQPNLPWAEDHFLERVSGIPHNPPPSEAWWPFAQQGNLFHKEGEQFSHTYPERMWPKFANEEGVRPNGRQVYVPHNGVRYEYGDLDDVISLLARSSYTRQAYLPIWFPEDTGAVGGHRVPCTLGYHFLWRGRYMDITYSLRSCDYLRHWRDDQYMAGRLLQHVVGKLQEAGKNVWCGSLIMNISSLHVFKADEYRMAQLAKAALDERSSI